MSTDVAQSESNAHLSLYIAAGVPAATTTTTVNDGSEKNPTVNAIKLLCTQRKKKTKRHIYLAFVESCSLSTSTEQSCIDIVGKTDSTSILLKECISCEYFDTVKNDFQAFIHIHFQSYTVSIYFSNEHSSEKALVIKHLEYMRQEEAETNEQVSSQGLPCRSITEHIVHAFDVKLIPYGTVIARDHVLIGQVRVYFTTTDLYIAAIDCSAEDLKKTITNQCPAKDKTILCIPYFTIRHYGNRSNVFLIEVGKSNYGNGEIHMKCLSSSLASTIHLLVSPVIEERPLILSSAFQNQLLTSKRMEKLKKIHPPVQLTPDATSPSLLTAQNSSLETLTTALKPRSVVGFFRKLVKTSSSLRRSKTFHVNEDNSEQQSNIVPPSLSTKFFELGIEETHPLVCDQLQSVPPRFQPITEPSELSIRAKSNRHSVLPQTFNNQDTTNGTYLDMGPPTKKSDQDQQEEVKNEEIGSENAATADIGINTMISIPPSARSAIIVGTTVHLIATEETLFPIGRRSFTSPASVLQPFKAQLNGPTTLNTCLTSTGMIACAPNSSSSFHHPTSTSNSQQSLLLSYGIITFNGTSMSADPNECGSSVSSEDPAINRRLDSDLSLMSTTCQQQPTNIYSLNDIFSSSSSSSHIFRTLSLSTTHRGENSSGSIPASDGSIMFFDESPVDQTTSYLLGPALSLPANNENTSGQAHLTRLSSTSSTRSVSRSHLSHIIEEKPSSNDSYASMEPLPLCDSSASSLSTILNGPSLASDKSVDYTDILLPSTSGDSQQDEVSASDANESIEERNEQPSTTLYTGVDFHQTQRRDRIAQVAAKVNIEDQPAPFVL